MPTYEFERDGDPITAITVPMEHIAPATKVMEHHGWRRRFTPIASVVYPTYSEAMNQTIDEVAVDDHERAKDRNTAVNALDVEVQKARKRDDWDV